MAVAAAAAVAVVWLTTANAFRLDPQNVHVTGVVYTDEQQLRDSIGLTVDARPNVFRLDSAQMAEKLRGLPSVAAAEVDVSLPDSVSVAVHEREPLFAWRTSGGAWLVDATGALLAPAPASTALPAVADDRSTATSLVAGDRLEDIDVAAARLLLTITPADVNSPSASVAVSVDDQDGWSITSQQPAWRAVFGFYTANELRPEDRVPRQRQCLSALLAERPAQPTVVYLAVAGDRCGTFRDEPTPAGYSVQNVSRRAA